MIPRSCFGAVLLASFLFSPAVAQVTSGNLEGPTITIDVLRVDGPGSRPAIDPVTGGITYTVGVTPDSALPAFGQVAGASIAAELGFVISGDGLSDDASAPIGLLPTDPSGQVIVNVNSSPGSGSTATEPDDGFVDFATPGNPLFDFEVPVFDLNNDNVPDVPGGVQVGVDGDSGLDAIFAAVGTTFFSASTLDQAPFELFRVRTARLDLSDLDSLVPSLTLVTGSLTAQAVDLSGAIPLSEIFFLPITQSDPIFVRDVVPEPATLTLLGLFGLAATVRRHRG